MVRTACRFARCDAGNPQLVCNLGIQPSFFPSTSCMQIVKASTFRLPFCFSMATTLTVLRFGRGGCLDTGHFPDLSCPLSYASSSRSTRRTASKPPRGTAVPAPRLLRILPVGRHVPDAIRAPCAVETIRAAQPNCVSGTSARARQPRKHSTSSALPRQPCLRGRVLGSSFLVSF